MRLKYHQRVFDILGKKPKSSKAAQHEVTRCEQRLGLTFPAALQEWYGLPGAADLLTKYSNNDPAIPVDELGTPDELRHQVLKIQEENQGVAAWYIQLDNSEDPPVYVESEMIEGQPSPLQPNLGWALEAPEFSEFIYQRVLQYGGNAENVRVVEALEKDRIFLTLSESGDIVEVAIEEPPINDETLLRVVALPCLERLQIGAGEITPQGWTGLHKSKELEHLEVGGEHFGPEAIDAVVTLPNLNGISLFETSIGDAGLMRLISEHQFAFLQIYGEGISEAAFSGIHQQERLTSLIVDGLEVGDRALSYISCVPTLEHLSLVRTQISDAGLEYLSKLRGLQSLELGVTEVSSRGVAHLAGLSQLKRLSLMDTSLDDAGMAIVGRLSNLTQLALGGTRVTEAGLESLNGLKKLTSLNLAGLKISEEAMDKLRKSHGSLEITG